MSAVTRPPDPDPSPPAGDAAQAIEVTRSEEELVLGTRWRRGRRARVQKHVVTDRITVEVEVRREELRVVHEPIDASDDEPSPEPPSGERRVAEVVLHEEVVDVTKRVVPTERATISTAVVTEGVEVSEQIARERVEVETADASTRVTRVIRADDR